MRIFDNPKYIEDVSYVAALDLPWNMLQDSSVLISGATGLVGSFLVDVLMHRNESDGMNCRIFAVSRNAAGFADRFCNCADSELLSHVAWDVNSHFCGEDVFSGITSVDYVVHLASNTHPVAYSTDPVGTILTNIFGTKNMLDFAIEHGAKRCAFASSNEVYGQNRGDAEKFDEKYCGYIDSNTLRAGYPESKRCGEALCQAYIKQHALDVVIPRITRSYGPTLLDTDTKALSQFLHKAVNGEDIVLKSEGMQYFSYLYVADTVAGLLTVLLKGECGQAYNISDEKSDIRLKDLANIAASYVGRRVVFELPDAVESAGYSTATKALLDNAKITELGWNARYDIKAGIERTIEIMRD